MDRRIARSLDTVRDIFRARGYTVEAGDREFYVTRGDEQRFVKYIPKAKMEDVRTFSDENEHGALITDESWSAMAAAHGKLHNIENFAVSRTQINILRHPDVPPHTRVDPAQAVKETGNTPVSKFPQLPRSDPVAAFIGAKVGEVYRIDRPSAPAGRAVTYRWIV